MLLFDYMVSGLIYRTWNHLFVLQVAQDALLLTIFGWLALKGSRWWAAVVSGALALILVVHALTAMEIIARYAVLSARMGLWLLIYSTLLAGIGERWLAGERPVSEGRGWRRRVAAAP